jgi:hypothetical protein
VTGDNCWVASVTNDFGASRNVGSFTLTFTVTDASSRTATATQTFTVIDDQLPTISVGAEPTRRTPMRATATFSRPTPVSKLDRRG